MAQSTSHVDLKVVLLGKEFCGKTSLVERFLNERFIGENRYQNTIGAAYGARKMEGTKCNGKTNKEIMVIISYNRTATSIEQPEYALQMGVWDTAGGERYHAISRIYYRGARAAIVCYDVTDADSWERLHFWIKELGKFEESCKIYICATKTDLVAGNNKRRRKVDYHTTTDLADEIGAIGVFETSSKLGEGVCELFQRVADDFLEDPANSYTEFEGRKLLPEQGRGKGDSTCC